MEKVKPHRSSDSRYRPAPWWKKQYGGAPTWVLLVAGLVVLVSVAVVVVEVARR